MLASRLRPIAGLLVLLALLLPWKLARAALESSLWMDEIYSLVMIHHPVERILDLTSVDFHPPGYYLALKAWAKLPRLAGGEPGLLWVRGLNVAAWVALAALAWWGGRRLFGRWGGTLLAWAVAGAAVAAQLAKDLRGYGPAFVAVTSAWIVLTVLDRRAAGDGIDSSPVPSSALWAVYTAALVVALWTHPLAAPLVALMGLVWLLLAARRRGAFLAAGAIAHALAALLYLPWLLRLGRQLGQLQEADPSWMTPATLANLARMYTVWLPFGPAGRPQALWVLLGAASLLVPAIALAIGRYRRGGVTRGSGAGGIALWSLVLGAAYMELLWTLQWAGVATVFHGPRVPYLAAGIWAVGLAALAVAATDRLGMGLGRAWMLLVPWLLAAGIGQLAAHRAEARPGPLQARPGVAELFPPAGGALYVMPSELLPYVRRSLRDLEPRRIEELGALSGNEAAVSALNLSSWPVLDRPRDLVARHHLTRSLAATVERRGFPQPRPEMTVFRLSGLEKAAVAALSAQGLVPGGRAAPADALALALPEGQRYADGWSFPEVGQGGVLSRWASVGSARVRFDRSVAAGGYRLRLRGYRAARPAAREKVRLTLLDRPGWSEERELGEGSFDLDLEVRLSRPGRPVLLVEHPVWSPADTGGSDTRRLSFVLLEAWIESP